MTGEELTILGIGAGPPRFLDDDGGAVAIPDLLHKKIVQQTTTKTVLRVLFELDTCEHIRYKVNLGKVFVN